MSVAAWVLVALILYVCCGALTALWASEAVPLPGVPAPIVGVLWPSVLIAFLVVTIWRVLERGGSS